MDEPPQGTAPYTVSVCATATVTGDFHSVHDLEQAILEATRAATRQLYAQAFAALQDRWLAAHRHRFSAQRWSTLRCLTPFGPVGLPVRAVRKKPSGRYLTLSKAFLRHKATRLLSPALEQEACAAATEQNYRHAARALSRWISARPGPLAALGLCAIPRGAPALGTGESPATAASARERPGPPPGTPGGKPNPNSISNPTRLDLPSPTDN